MGEVGELSRRMRARMGLCGRASADEVQAEVEVEGQGEVVCYAAL